MMKRLATAAALMLLTAFSARAAVCPNHITTTLPFLNLPCQKDDPRWADAYEHWNKRSDAEEVKAAVALFEDLAKEKPDSLERHLWLARGYYALGMKSRGAEQIAIMKKSVAEADQALKMDPGNETAPYWRWAAMVFYHEYTKEDFGQIKAFGQKYQHLRELPVPDDDPLWAEAMPHWDARYQREEGEKAIAIFEQLEKKYPDRIEPKLWLMRSHYWMHYIEPDNDAKAKQCRQAADWGEKAIAMEPRNPAANYITAASLGMYGSHTNFANYVRYAYGITEKLMIVMEEDPNYFYGGVSQYFCLAIARAGSLVTKSLDLVGYPSQLIEKNTVFAANYEPRYLRNFLALAEMYLSQNRNDEAKQMLEKVINNDPSALKNMEPENRVAQDLAREMMKEHFPE